MILVTEFMDEAAVAALEARFAVAYEPGLADRQGEIPARMAGVRALIVRNRTKVTPALLDAAPDLACVGRLGVGLDNIDMAACAARGVTVYPATGANDASVAEYVIAAAMLLLRGAFLMSGRVAAGGWPRQEAAGREIAGKRLGLLGFGAIARETARKARGLGMDVAAHDPFLAADDPAWTGATRQDLPALLAELPTLDVTALANETDERPVDPNQALVEPLTARELEVLHLLAEGLSNQQIAERLTLAEGTVKYYTRQIYGKLQVHNRVRAVALARELGLV